ncbi:HDOD domain-containing protein [Massilia sp. HP4]|uniref:HDOD domain-containing protein n=1 Tax=Massilia sp. HP4 TaxID=2562316 RepID=UPI0010BF6B64|nr:HDOD domain-containing protein [Massilia sp. HP4]
MAEQGQYPLVAIDPVANAQNEWVALSLRLPPGADLPQRLQVMFAGSELLDAIAPLDCLLHLDSPAALTVPVLALLPANRVGLVIAAAALNAGSAARQLAELHACGYRIWLDGNVPEGTKAPAALRAVARDCRAERADRATALPPGRLVALFGPHLAHGVDRARDFSTCEIAGFDWFSGDYPYDPDAAPSADDDGSSRRRILTLLGLLARDAESRELEHQIKQDPTLAYHLLKLVNSAAFAVSTEITSFAHAITVLGRRQLQRWLQLLLYARQQPDGLPNLLLPLAARRAAQLEALSRAAGGDRDAQDLAFMTGVFSLLDRLLHMPMAAIAADLYLPDGVAGALLERRGRLGAWLRLAETQPDALALEEAGVSPGDWWASQLHAYHWAIQVGRNV